MGTEAFMPKFELVPVAEAMLKSATGKRADIRREYMDYVASLPPGKAGRLRPTEGERVGAVSRRIGAAAKMVGKDVVIKRSGDEVYFWLRKEGRPTAPRRRGRPRRTT